MVRKRVAKQTKVYMVVKAFKEALETDSILKPFDF